MVFSNLFVCVCVLLVVSLVDFFNGFASWHGVAWWLWWWLLASVWWVKWDVSGGFLMGFVGAWLPGG